MSLKNCELLAPAGNFSKLETALHFGADAVYLGGKSFSLRSFADNFTRDELCRAFSFAHEKGKKVYVTANIFARNSDFEELKDYFRFLSEAGADAVLISDPGVIYLCKSVAPNLPIHLSTQANTTNAYAVKFWKEQGLSRVVLAREVSLKEVEEIHSFVPDIEIEAFAHGAMCISYSGRCLLSNYLAGRESNRGECVQACRWQYSLKPISPVSETGNSLLLEEDERGTYLLNSKDLNMISHLEEMEKAGVTSFKIEGRMKSEYYLATVVNAYRRAMDFGKSEKWEEELYSVQHRDFTTAYAFGENEKTVNENNSQEKGTCEYIALVKGYEEGCVFAEMRNRFQTGDTLEILSSDENFRKSFVVGEFFTSKGEKVTDGKLVQEVYQIPCPYALQKGDILRRRRG